jgi:hypothetical protein
MSATAEIRSKLPLCGRCKNCKVIVWGKEAKNSELKTSATIIKNSDAGNYFTIRCNWLKTAVIEPFFLENCEGRQGFEDVS